MTKVGLGVDDELGAQIGAIPELLLGIVGRQLGVLLCEGCCLTSLVGKDWVRSIPCVNKDDSDGTCTVLGPLGTTHTADVEGSGVHS